MSVTCPLCLSRPRKPCRDSRGRFQKETHVIRREIERERYEE